MKKLLLALVLGSTLLSSSALAQDDFGSGTSQASTDTHADSLKLVGWFQVGAGGTAESNGASAELDPSVGLGARLEIPITEWLVLGGLFNMSFWRAPVISSGRNTWFDFDVMVKGFYGFDVGGFGFEAYAYIPVGVTLATMDAPNTDAGFGWNMGLLFGLAWYFIEDLGAIVEMGWLHHHTTHNLEMSAIDYGPKANQFVMNFGVVLPF